MARKYYYCIEPIPTTGEKSPKTVAIRDRLSDTVEQLTKLLAKFTHTRGFCET